MQSSAFVSLHPPLAFFDLVCQHDELVSGIKNVVPSLNITYYLVSAVVANLQYSFHETLIFLADFILLKDR